MELGTEWGHLLQITERLVAYSNAFSKSSAALGMVNMQLTTVNWATARLPASRGPVAVGAGSASRKASDSAGKRKFGRKASSGCAGTRVSCADCLAIQRDAGCRDVGADHREALASQVDFYAAKRLGK